MAINLYFLRHLYYYYYYYYLCLSCFSIIAVRDFCFTSMGLHLTRYCSQHPKLKIRKMFKFDHIAPIQVENRTRRTTCCDASYLLQRVPPFILLISCLLSLKCALLSPFQRITEVPLNCVIPQVASSKY